MGRLDRITKQIEENDKVAIEGELDRLDGRPDTIPQDVWDEIQENGRLATTRLNEILRSPRFGRLRASDQAKLIALAQNRAYGNPVAPKQEAASRKRGGTKDVINAELDNLAYRSSLPEYRKVGVKSDE